jgi:hypothetical protein
LRLEEELQEGKNVAENQKRIDEIKKERYDLVQKDYKEKYQADAEKMSPDKELTSHEKKVLELELKMMRIRQQARRLPDSLSESEAKVDAAKQEALRKKAVLDKFNGQINSTDYEKAAQEHSKSTSELEFAAREQASVELGMVVLQQQHADLRRQKDRMTGQISAVENFFKDKFSKIGKTATKEAISKRTEQILKKGTFFRIRAEA